MKKKNLLKLLLKLIATFENKIYEDNCFVLLNTYKVVIRVKNI